MATFEARIEGLTGLSIDGSSSPTQTELIEYLKDGVFEITSRNILLRPHDRDDYTRVTSELDTNGNNIGSAEIVSVVRESGEVNDWRECRKVSPALQSRVTDIDSLHYASKYNPAFIKWNDKSIVVYPAPGASPNRYKIFYVNNVPTFSGGGTTYECDTIHYFPNDKVYLVMLYASIKSLENALSAKSTELPSNIADLVMPVPPAGLDVDFSSLSSIETFVSPVFTLPTTPTINDMTLPDPPAVPVLSGSGSSGGNTYTLPTSGVPVFVPPIISPDYDDANNWINVEEDEELLAARIQVINARISQYQADLQNARFKFDGENVEYQAKLQKSEKDATLGSGDDQNIIAKFRAEVEKYTQVVTKEVQRYRMEEVEVVNSQWVQEVQARISQYQADIQKEQAKVGSSIQRFQTEADKILREYSAETGYDTSIYQNQIQYKVSAYNADIQNYIAKTAKVKADYEWMLGRLSKLQQEYDTAFMVMQPKQQQGGK